MDQDGSLGKELEDIVKGLEERRTDPLLHAGRQDPVKTGQQAACNRCQYCEEDTGDQRVHRAPKAKRRASRTREAAIPHRFTWISVNISFK